MQVHSARLALAACSVWVACQAVPSPAPSVATAAPAAPTTPSRPAPPAVTESAPAAPENPSCPEFLRPAPAGYPMRAWVARVGPFAVTEDEPLQSHREARDAASGFEVVVLDVREPVVRVVHERGGLRIALHVRSDDLARRVAKRTVLSPRPEDAGTASDPATTVFPGAAPAELEHQGDLARVRFSEAGVVVEGWLKTSALDRTYPAHDPLLADEGSAMFLRRDTQVLHLRNGTTVLDLDAGEFWGLVLPLGRARGGLRPVEVWTKHLRVVGRMRVEDAEEKPFETSSVTGGVRFFGFGNQLVLPEGTLLYDSPGGSIVGVVRGEGEGTLDGKARRGVWREAAYRTPWGPADLWVVCPAIARGRENYGFRCTEASDPARLERLPKNRGCDHCSGERP